MFGRGILRSAARISGVGCGVEWAFVVLAWRMSGSVVDIWQGPERRSVSETFRGRVGRGFEGRGGLRCQELNRSRRRRS